MTPLEERNLVWNVLELLLYKYNLENDCEFLDPIAEDDIIFGNFISGHPMSFESDFELLVIDLSRKLPSSFEIVKSNIFGTAEGCIGIKRC